jgi:hypothetical protein
VREPACIGRPGAQACFDADSSRVARDAAEREPMGPPLGECRRWHQEEHADNTAIHRIAVAQLSPVRRVINTTEPTEQHKRREDPPEFTRHSRFERLDDRLKCAMGEHLKHPYSWTASATFSARA